MSTKSARQRDSLTLDLLDRDEWDLFAQVFTEAHCVGHQCWHLHDPTHPSHDEATALPLSDPVKRVYRAIDRAVADIVERAGDAQIVLFSAHGMGAYRGADFLLSEILYRLGATARPSVTLRVAPTLGGRVVGTARSAWGRLPWAVRERLRPLRARLATTPQTGPQSVSVWADVTASKCFAVPNGSPVSGIRLNLVGREPHGALRPEDVDTFCDGLVRDLLDIVDQRTDSPLITAVDRTDTLYSGNRRDALPDLLVTWNDTHATGFLAHAGGRGAAVRASSQRIGDVEGRNRYGRTGEHRPEGFFVSVGRGVPAAERPEPVRLTYFHPTICALMGLPHAAVDGDPILELVGARH